MKREILIFLTTINVLIKFPSAQTPPYIVTPQELNNLYQELDERIKRLQNQLDEVLNTQVRLAKRLDELNTRYLQLESQIQTLMQLTNRTYVTPQQMQSVISNLLQTLEKQRSEDLKAIRERLESITKSLEKSLTEPKPTPRQTYAYGYEYIVQPGDTLSKIIAAYRKEGINVTLQMVLEANPGLNPDNIKVGQKIFIPDPGLNSRNVPKNQ